VVTGICEICGLKPASNKCKICGRNVCRDHIKDDICTICRETLCTICNKRPSIGYCSICGRLACDECLVQIDNVRRICVECLAKLGGIIEAKKILKRKTLIVAPTYREHKNTFTSPI